MNEYIKCIPIFYFIFEILLFFIFLEKQKQSYPF